MIEYIRWYDYILFLILLVAIILFSRSFLKKKISPDIYSYFLNGIIIKLIASQIYVHIYIYYYTFGDTIRFFRFGQFYKNLLSEISNIGFFEWLFMDNEKYMSYIHYRIDYSYGFADSSFFINKISGILSFITFDSFLLNTALFSLMSYFGLWFMYIAFIKMYPQLKREFAVSILFLPSVVFWGAGLMKDTLSLAAIGYMTYNFCRVFILKDKLSIVDIILNVLMFVFCSYVISQIKVYQLLAYLPGTFLWLFYHYRGKIKSDFIRISITPALLTFVGFAIIFGLQAFSEELDKYALENVVDTALALSYDLGRQDAGSTYDLGVINPTIGGLLSKIPAAVNVTLYRPYLFEAKNIVMLFSSIESTLVLIISIYIFFKVGIFNFIKKVLGSGVLLYCFVFTLIFAFLNSESL